MTNHYGLFKYTEFDIIDMKKFAIVVFVLLVFISQSGFADGIYFSEHDSHMTEPDQKAIISWDGEKETMILVSTTQMDEISNLAWVVPIQSSIKPEVTEGNITIFRNIVSFFNNKKRGAFGAEKMGVDVVEMKEIDIYDIAILKATDAAVLIEWLNDNGYIVPDDLEPVLNYYIEKPDFYFIANKIDMSNKFSDEVKTNTKYNDFSDLDDLVHDREFIFDILMGVDFSKTELSEDVPVFEDDYNKLKEKYYSENYEKMSLFLKGTPDLNFYSKVEIEFIDDSYYSIKVLYHDPDCTYDCNPYGNHISKSDIEALGMSPEEYFEYLKSNYTSFLSDYNNVYNEIIDSVYPYYEYHSTLYNLQKGLGTPLKFEFYPEQPYYPLEISSLSKGETNIEVYVVTNNPVYDLSGILEVSESYTLGGLKSSLEEHMDIGNARYITRLSYEGALSELNEDAVFEEEDMGFFDYYITVFQSWFASWW